MVGNKIFRDQSSRGAIFLAKTLEKRKDRCSIFDKAKKFGTKIVLIEECNVNVPQPQKSISRCENVSISTKTI